jgi:hypothetical protein
MTSASERAASTAHPAEERWAGSVRPSRSPTRMLAELSCNEPLVDAHNSLLPPEAMRLPSVRATSDKVYRDAAHQSRLVGP